MNKRRKHVSYYVIRQFAIMTGSGFVNYSKSLIKIMSPHGNLNGKDFLPHSNTISRNTQKEAHKLHKSLIPSFQSLIDLRQYSASTNMLTDDYKHKSYTSLMMHLLIITGSCGVKCCSLVNSPMIGKLPVISVWSQVSHLRNLVFSHTFSLKLFL
jgi:hypothetical protein